MPGKDLGWIVDLIESSTTYHREPRDVKIKVGWIRLLGMFITLALVGFMAWTITTTNMHLEEVVPVGQFSHWAGGGGAVSARGNKQWVNSSLCKYDEQFDYKYGLDNEWDYGTASCERTSLGENAFKSASSLHFVTFESQRLDVLLPKNGSSCDEECQTVYPEWPAAESYGDNSFRSVHVKTKLDTAMRGQTSDLRKAANVHLMKPQDSGADRCQCYSYQNIFKLGIDAASLYFTHSYSTQHVRGSSKATNEYDPISILVADGASEPFSVIEKGNAVSFVLEQVLTALGTCLDCQPESEFWQNSICNKTTGCLPPYQPKPTPRASGMMIDVRTEFYSHPLTMPQGPLFAWIIENHEPPYAIHIFSKYEDWASRGSDSTTIEDSPQRKVTVDNYRYGVLFRMKPAAGVISRVNMSVMVNNLCNFTVMMGYPGMIMTMVVFVFMGRKSKIFRKSQRTVVTVPDMFRSYTYSAMVAKKAFDAFDGNGSGFIDRSELKEHVKKLMLPAMRSRFPEKSEAWHHQQICSYADEMIDGFSNERGRGVPGKARGITYEEFLHHATFTQALDMDDLTNEIADSGTTTTMCGLRKKTKSDRAVACAPEPFQSSSVIFPDGPATLEGANEMLGRLQDSTKKNTEEQARQMQTFKDTRNKETAELQQEVLGVKAEMAAVSSALKSLAEKNPEQAPEEPEELS